VDPRSHRKKEIGAYIVVELFAGPGRTWCSGVQSKNIHACIALQVKAKESNIQRARARGLRKNSLGKRQRNQAKGRSCGVGHFGALGLRK
jgi:hypothetical protein